MFLVSSNFSGILAASDYLITLPDYVPNRTAAGIFGGLSFIISILSMIQVARRKNWWGLCLPLGALGVSTLNLTALRTH